MYEYSAKYLSNYDGDTCTLELDCGFNIFHHITVRLLGCDTFEMNDKDPAKKALAQQGKKLTQDTLLSAKRLVVNTYKDETDKYGRYLAKITAYDAKDQPIDLVKLLTESKLTTGKWVGDKPV
jgi:micrococcal nuclease